MRTIFSHLQYKQHTPLPTYNTMTSGQLNQSTQSNEKRFKTRSLSVADELYWYNNNTNWSALTRKEFRDIMILMETITMRFYDDYGDLVYPNRSAAIKKFWAEEWGCEYLPDLGEWWDLSSDKRIDSETEKKARHAAAKAAAKEEKAAAKAEKKAAKAAKKQQKKQQLETSQYNDEEEELYKQALQQQQQQQQQSYDEWYDAEEEAYAEAYANARAADELKQQQEAQAYLDQKEEQEEEEEEPKPRVACQPVLYLEELTEVAGDPDWRAYIYYDARIRRYVFKGTRRSVKTAHCKKTSYPEVKLCFRSSRELASYLCMSTVAEEYMNISMFAMASATVKEATFAELYALPARGNRTELFGYDRKYMRYSTFVDCLCMLRDVDASHSNFAAF